MTTHVLQDRPEPVTDAAKLAGAVAAAILAIGGCLRLLGVVLPVDVEDLAQQASNVVLALAVVWSLGGPWLLARLRARDLVTPLIDARDDTGTPLITRDTALAQARAEVADEPGQHAADR